MGFLGPGEVEGGRSASCAPAGETGFNFSYEWQLKGKEKAFESQSVKFNIPLNSERSINPA